MAAHTKVTLERPPVVEKLTEALDAAQDTNFAYRVTGYPDLEKAHLSHDVKRYQV